MDSRQDSNAASDVVTAQPRPRPAVCEEVDAAIVGMGFAGMALTYKLRALGVERLRSFEIGGDVGGTWYWNRYPGAACDIESYLYSFQFCKDLEQEWSWSRKYAGQPEILRYARHVAERFDLRRDVLFNTRVCSAEWDAARERWVVQTDKGDRVMARALFLANGPLSQPAIPRIQGMEEFGGACFHTHDWDCGAELTGKRVGVIGTGSSATQLIPELAKVAAHLTVFQRSAAWCAPRRNAPITEEREARIKADYPSYRAKNFVEGEDPLSVGGFIEAFARADRGTKSGEGDVTAAMGPVNDPALNRHLQQHLTARLRETVHDPATAQALMPNYPVSCKRLCISDRYWPTFNRPNVTLVDLRGRSIERVTAHGPVGPDGRQYEVDVLVCATGFDAMTGVASGQLGVVRGKDGRTLTEHWARGPRTHLGMMTDGFPNLFMVCGPQCPAAVSDTLGTIERQATWMSRLFHEMRRHGARVAEAEPDAVDKWIQRCRAQNARTVWGGVGGGCGSWYNKANLGKDPGVAREPVMYTATADTYFADIERSGLSGIRFDGEAAAARGRAML